MVLIFSAMAGASVWFPRCCSECGCGKRRGSLPAEAQCTSTKMDSQAPRCRLLGFSFSSRLNLRSAAESKDAQTSVACCRGEFIIGYAARRSLGRHLASLKLHGFMLSLKWLVCSSVSRPEEIEDLLFGNQAFESLVRLESVFKQRSVMSDSGASPGLDGCRQRGSASFG